MSTSLYWRLQEDGRKSLGYQIKFYIAPEWWGHDGSLGSDEYLVTEIDFAFLRGIIAGTNQPDVKKEAQKIIDLVDKHGPIFVWLQS